MGKVYSIGGLNQKLSGAPSHKFHKKVGGSPSKRKALTRRVGGAEGRRTSAQCNFQGEEPLLGEGRTREKFDWSIREEKWDKGRPVAKTSWLGGKKDCRTKRGVLKSMKDCQQKGDLS